VTGLVNFAFSEGPGDPCRSSSERLTRCLMAGLADLELNEAFGDTRGSSSERKDSCRTHAVALLGTCAPIVMRILAAAQSLLTTDR